MIPRAFITLSNKARLAGCALVLVAAVAHAEPEAPLFHDSHFHLTNYIQEGVDIRDFLELMGDEVGRVALFGIPLQQTWSHGNTGDFAPTYYLHTDAPLYYYSFTDAFIAQTYLSLDEAQRNRFDPMITGFNPADMYGVEHIRRVLQTFPGVFSGIGEFSIHKEFVSSKVAGETASLVDPALDRIFEFTAETGLVSILHCDIDVPFANQMEEPIYLRQMAALLRRHPESTIIWAHTGLGRVVTPKTSSASASATTRSPNHLEYLKMALADEGLDHVYFDISWDEVAKYIVASEARIEAMAAMVNAYPTRFLFGTDAVAPRERDSYMKVYRQYAPLWDALSPEARALVTRGNYERLFDRAREQVRAWERENVVDHAPARSAPSTAGVAPE